jgi:hypothetical protein
MALKAENILEMSEVYSSVAFTYLKSNEALEVISGLIYANAKLKRVFEKLNIVSQEAMALIEKELEQAAQQDVEEAWVEKVRQIVKL